MISIPRGWTYEPLTKFIDSRSGNGKLIKGKQSLEFIKGFFPAYSASGQDIWTEKAEFFGEGVVVSAVGARCGKAFLAEGSWTAVANTHVLQIKKGAELDIRFLWYLCNDEKWWIRSGTAQPFVKVKDTLERLQLVPPLAEQHKIVERIEAALASVRDCQTGLELIRQKQADLRRKLFHESFVGGPTLEAKTPFPGTEVASLGEIATWGSGGTPSTKVPSHYVGDIPWAVIGDLTESNVIRTEKSISAEALKSSSAKIFSEGSVMVAMYGASIGRTGIAGIDMATNQAIAVAQPNPSKVRGDYLLYFLQSQKEAFVAAGQGGAQPNISQQVIKGWLIALPSLSEQKRVVQELDSQFARLASANETLSHLQLQIANLKAAVLTSSFTQKSVGEI